MTNKIYTYSRIINKIVDLKILFITSKKFVYSGRYKMSVLLLLEIFLYFLQTFAQNLNTLTLLGC